MSHYMPTPNERRARRWARLAILSAANRNRQKPLAPFSMRTIQDAVFKCRQRRLVKDTVLVAAGFRPNRPRAKVAAAPAEKAAA